MDRARELIQPYVERDDVIGVYLVGSATRPFCDEHSDYDLEVVVTDASYVDTPDEARHVFVLDEGPPRKVDHEFYLRPWSEFEALVDCRQDIVRYGYQHAEVLHDPEGRIAKVIQKLGDLPGIVRHERLRVHYLQLVFVLGRTKKTLERDPERALDVRLLLAEALGAAVKLLFIVCGSWPSSLHWTRAELYLLGVPEDLLAKLAAASATTDLAAWKTLLEAIEAFMTSERQTFHQDRESLVRWAYLTEEGKAAFERWSTG